MLLWSEVMSADGCLSQIDPNHVSNVLNQLETRDEKEEGRSEKSGALKSWKS